MGKKNLEQLFKETFGGFQETPDTSVWDSIELSLNKKKKKKRAVVLWWQLGGVAAALVIAILAFNPFEQERIMDTPTISDIENEQSPAQHDEIKEDTNLEIKNTPSESLAESNKKDDDIENFSASKSSSQKNRTSISVVQKKALASNNNNERETSKTSAETLAQAPSSSTNSISTDQDAIASKNPTSKRLTEKSNSKEDAVIAVNKDEEIAKKSIYEAIEEQKELDAEVAEIKLDKWSVGPSIAPVYFNGSGSGSPIHSDFETNSKSGNFNLSYGVGVAYEVNKRLKIRSGVHKVNYGYDTNDVLFTSTLRTSSNEKISNISYTENSENIIVQSKNSGKSISDVSSKEVALASSPALDGKMVQQLGYIEVPLELNYAIIDKKFGVDVIGGVSSLFLIDNSVLLESNSLITEVGEANNVNSLNFSANFGMGINYDFTPKFQLNIEPVFKYQLNTFSNTSGTFRPYSVGIYSGVSFKF